MTSALPPSVPVLACAGVPIAAVGPTGAVGIVIEATTRLPSSGTGVDVHLCNTYTLALADQDDAYRELLQNAWLNLADGTPVIWANRMLHRNDQPPRERVRGPGFFNDVLELGQRQGLRHYLLGSTDETLALLRGEIEKRYPKAIVVGMESPPFRQLDDDEQSAQDARIAASAAQIVWVGLGTPKQDLEASRLAQDLPVVAIAIGAAFDFLAGTVAEAPVWMQRNGLEWIHRLAIEPRRLWKRYLIGGPRFAKAVIVRREK